MTTYSVASAVLRGALVSVDTATLAPSVIPFQYNPHTVTRSFEVRGASSGPEVGQLGGPPVEKVQVEIELDAADEMAIGKGEEGVGPALAALVSLVSPRSVDIIANIGRAASGVIEILPPDGPVTLFVFGPRRVLPVQLTELSITEEAHDASLIPIRARASVGMRVLSATDLPSGHPAQALAVANEVSRETLARGATVGNLDAVLGSGASLL